MDIVTTVSYRTVRYLGALDIEPKHAHGGTNAGSIVVSLDSLSFLKEAHIVTRKIVDSIINL